MGCGASAVREQIPQSGPAGSGASLARWKRRQQSQIKIVECSQPISKDEKEAPSEAETNCGESTTDETRSRPVSRESMLSESASQVSADEITESSFRQLRLQLSKACVAAAKSGELSAALQQVRTKPQSTAICLKAPPNPPPSSRPSARKKTTPGNDQKTATEDLKCKGVDDNEAQKPQKISSEEIDDLRRKSAAALTEMVSKPETFEHILKSCKSYHAASQESHDVDLDGIKSKLFTGLQQNAEAGVLDQMLQESMEAASKPKDSEQWSQDASHGNDLDGIRQKAVNILGKAASSGVLEKAMSTILTTQKTNGDDDRERVRQKAVLALENAAALGSLQNVLAAKANKVDDKVLLDIRQRVALSFVKGAQSGCLANALSTMTAREKARAVLERSVCNGSLEKAVNTAQKETQKIAGTGDDEIERIRQKAQASLEVFLQGAA